MHCRKHELIPRSELVIPWRPLYKLLYNAQYSSYEHYGLIILPSLVLFKHYAACYGCEVEEVQVTRRNFTLANVFVDTLQCGRQQVRTVAEGVSSFEL
jgi:hypothetical protein